MRLWQTIQDFAKVWLHPSFCYTIQTNLSSGEKKKKNKKKKIKRGKQLSARHLKRRTENKQNTASLNLKAQYINKQMILI